MLPLIRSRISSSVKTTNAAETSDVTWLGSPRRTSASMPSAATGDLNAEVVLTDAEIRERMSGNICRCSAYPQILDAIRDVAGAAA